MLIRLLGGHRTLGRPRARRCGATASQPGRFTHARGSVGRAGGRRSFPSRGHSALADGAAGGNGGAQRDFEYLSGFASTPFHLVNFVAPGLLPSFAAVAALGVGPVSYVARGAIWLTSDWFPFFWPAWPSVREWRRDAAVRLLAILLVVTLCLESRSLRARVSVLDHAAGLFLLSSSVALEPGHVAGAGLLAGKGFDGWLAWPRPGSLVAAVHVSRRASGSWRSSV